MRVAIAGAGNVGLFIANDLVNTGHEVLLIEQNQDVVQRQQPHAAGGVEWIVADACEVASLRIAGLERCDVVVAATGDDEDNLVISLLAKQEFGVPRVVARVNHPKNEWLFNENWGVDLSVSTPHLITALVEEAVSVGRLVRILQFEGGNVRLVEVTLAENAPVVDKAIRDLDIPRDATIVAVVRGEHVVMPRGDTMFESGDEVLAMVTSDSEDASVVHRRQSVASQQLIHRVVDHAVGRAVCVAMIRDDAFQTDASSGRETRDLPPAEEHRGHGAATVLYGCFERGRAGAGNDAHRSNLADDLYGSPKFERIERCATARGTPRLQLLAVLLVHRFGKFFDEFS